MGIQITEPPSSGGILNDDFIWHIGAWDFVGSGNNVSGGIAIAFTGVSPTLLHDSIFAPLVLPYNLNNQSLIIDSITVYFHSLTAGNSFDFNVYRTNHSIAGGVTVKTVADVASGISGNGNVELLQGVPLAINSYAHYVKINMKNCSSPGDLKIFDIKFTGHFE